MPSKEGVVGRMFKAARYKATCVSAGVKVTLNDGARSSETVNNKGAARAPLLCASSIRTAGHVR